ncbi:DUF1775 domain-containing protein [Actinoplanes sp. GCM10030250]|uniref:DUF1775 domain-containing protein n=1 Tax=Actinoplanes sp. GCM10030250 TaxID=3273376 RepID=UPI00361B8790
MARRAGVLAAVTTGVVLSAAAPAAADVTVSPATAAQGSGENLYFHVSNEGTVPVTEVTVRTPADTPIAELYPLSVDTWAPKIEWQELSTPIQPIHGASPITTVPSSITWLAVGKTLAPGQAADLGLAAGPLPQLSTMKFTVEMKYADGSKAPAQTATLSLTPSDGSATGTHHNGTGTGTTGDLTPGEQAAFDKILDDADAGPSLMSISGWVVAVLALLGAGWVMLRNRHRAEEEPGDTPAEPEGADEDESEKEPVAAGSGTSKWAFKG